MTVFVDRCQSFLLGLYGGKAKGPNKIETRFETRIQRNATTSAKQHQNNAKSRHHHESDPKTRSKQGCQIGGLVHDLIACSALHQQKINLKQGFKYHPKVYPSIHANK